ncbi:hypothetical protein C8J56DRAFT_1056361 [Mycena floridula]|nr:hypothetical protein C8J56DRAFT_1056361 [Mycena floridula]
MYQGSSSDPYHHPQPHGTNYYYPTPVSYPPLSTMMNQTIAHGGIFANNQYTPYNPTSVSMENFFNPGPTTVQPNWNSLGSPPAPLPHFLPSFPTFLPGGQQSQWLQPRTNAYMNQGGFQPMQIVVQSTLNTFAPATVAIPIQPTLQNATAAPVNQNQMPQAQQQPAVPAVGQQQQMLTNIAGPRPNLNRAAVSPDEDSQSKFLWVVATTAAAGSTESPSTFLCHPDTVIKGHSNPYTVRCDNMGSIIWDTAIKSQLALWNLLGHILDSPGPHLLIIATFPPPPGYPIRSPQHQVRDEWWRCDRVVRGLMLAKLSPDSMVLLPQMDDIFLSEMTSRQIYAILKAAHLTNTWSNITLALDRLYSAPCGNSAAAVIEFSRKWRSAIAVIQGANNPNCPVVYAEVAKHFIQLLLNAPKWAEA